MGFRQPHYPKRKTTGYLFCLNCFHESPVTLYPSTADYMDGLPMLSVAQQMAQYTICQCGIFLDKERGWLECAQYIDTDEYQKALQIQDDMTKKFTIMQYTNSQQLYVALLRLHYAHEQHQPVNAIVQECLAISKSPQQSSDYTVRLPHVIQSNRSTLKLPALYRTIDLLRQGSQWDDALRLIEAELQTNPSEKHQKILQYEIEAIQNRVNVPI